MRSIKLIYNDFVYKYIQSIEDDHILHCFHSEDIPSLTVIVMNDILNCLFLKLNY